MAATRKQPQASGELDVLARLRSRLGGSPGVPALMRPLAGEVFSGDDAAVLAPPPGPLLLAIDLVVEGVHIDLSIGSLADAGWKAISVNASDIAAMGGRPLHVVAGVSAPPETDFDALTDGMLEACAAYRIALVGGDLTSGERLVLSVAITGTCDGRKALLRTGARPGDVIWVTGPLGASAAGLDLLCRPQGRRVDGSRAEAGAAGELVQAYRRPVARVTEGCVAAECGATSMIDVSDGLSQDLDHIATESGVGIRLDLVPVAGGASLEQALGGGEDYELVFTADSDARVVEAFEAAGLAVPIRIGSCSTDARERSLEGRPFQRTGWEHSFRSTR